MAGGGEELRCAIWQMALIAVWYGQPDWASGRPRHEAGSGKDPGRFVFHLISGVVSEDWS